MLDYMRMATDELSIGVDMGGTSIKFAVVQGTDIVYKAEPMQTTDYPSPDCIVEEIGRRLRAIMEKYPSVKAVGMGLPLALHRKVTTCARVHASLGPKRSALTPAVTPLATAHRTGS